LKTLKHKTMTSRQFIQHVLDNKMPLDTKFYKSTIIDGNDGSKDVEYHLTPEERDSECEGLSSGYFYERSNGTFKASAYGITNS